MGGLKDFDLSKLEQINKQFCKDLSQLVGFCDRRDRLGVHPNYICAPVPREVWLTTSDSSWTGGQCYKSCGEECSWMNCVLVNNPEEHEGNF